MGETETTGISSWSNKCTWGFPARNKDNEWISPSTGLDWLSLKAYWVSFGEIHLAGEISVLMEEERTG